MKTKEISFDVIQQIKANNRILEKLCQIENLMNELTDIYGYGFKGFDTDFYNDEKDNCLNYWHEFAHLIELHQRELVKNSKELMQ